MSQRLLPLWRTVPTMTERSGPDPGPTHVASADECECGHPIADHDAIAARYCRATATGALPPACMCPPGDAAGALARRVYGPAGGTAGPLIPGIGAATRGSRRLGALAHLRVRQDH